MRINFNNEKLKFYIGDVRDYESISSAMIGVDYVFHLAALADIVPSIENIDCPKGNSSIYMGSS